MASKNSFSKFISDIEPSNSTVDYISSVQNNLRSYLKNHELYKHIYNYSFLSGSYAKHTAIRPTKSGKKRDVDIIVVTNYSREIDSKKVLIELKDVLSEKSIYKNVVVQHHSIGVELSTISIDIVPVIINENNQNLFEVCNSETGGWILSDPEGHKIWSTKINEQNSRKYKSIVKIIKWWRHINCPIGTKFPKGITIERIIADNISDCEGTIENALISTFNNIISKYKEDYADKNAVPFLADPSPWIQSNNLLKNYSVKDFKEFIKKINDHLDILNQKGTTNSAWREILGDRFPLESTCSQLNCQTLSLTATHKQYPKWPVKRGGAAVISLIVKDSDGMIINYESNGEPLKKGLTLLFNVGTGVKKPFTLFWQITNTGEEARKNNCLRGGFELSNLGGMKHKEITQYTGQHSVQCFVIKEGVCVAISQNYIINII